MLPTSQVPRRDKKGSTRITIRKKSIKPIKGTPATPTPSFPGDRENREKTENAWVYLHFLKHKLK